MTKHLSITAEKEAFLSSDQQEAEIYFDILKDEITDFIKTIDYSSLTKAKNLILAAECEKKRIHITGIGKPAYVAGYMASLFSSTGTPAYYLHGTEAVHGSSGQVLPRDVVIAISNSGETAELKATVKALKENDVRIISVTRNKDSWLGRHSDIALTAKVSQEGDSLNRPPRCSIIAELILLQSLSILLQNSHGLTEKQYIRWHPGGTIGDEIRRKAKDTSSIQ